VETDVDERRLHSREDPDYPAFVDVADDPLFVLPLQVVLSDRSLFDQRHPGLLTRGVDHQDVGHRRILVTSPRAKRRTLRAYATGRLGARARGNRSEKPGRTPVPASEPPGRARHAHRTPKAGLLPRTRPGPEKSRTANPEAITLDPGQQAKPPWMTVSLHLKSALRSYDTWSAQAQEGPGSAFERG